jgi:hypothetical protein
MTDAFDQSSGTIVHDLQKLAFSNACYIGWVGSGAGLGALWGSGAALVGAGPGAFIGGVAGLIWAIKTCKPATSAAGELMTTSFLTEGELRAFQERLNQYAPVNREQALALAKIALDAYPQPYTGSLPIDFGMELGRALRTNGAA